MLQLVIIYYIFCIFFKIHQLEGEVECLKKLIQVEDLVKLGIVKLCLLLMHRLKQNKINNGSLSMVRY